MSERLGELLVRENLISLGQLKQAQEAQRRTGERLTYTLTKLGLVGQGDLTTFLSAHYGVHAINLDEFQIDDEVIKLIPRELANQHQVLPVNRAGSTLIVAMSDPSNLHAIDDIKFNTGLMIEVVVASEEALRSAIERYYDESVTYEEIIDDMDIDDVEVADSESEEDVVDLERSSEDAPVVRLVNLILIDAIKRNASDIHIEPYEKSFRVRYRIDGVLYEIMNPPLKLKNAITSRIKIMSALDIAERRLPQDGRIKIKLGGGKEMDFRVSVLPTLFGEKIVMRLLDKSNLQLDMTKLGFEPHQIDIFKDAIHKPFGMVLVTGPTGSGKTTTLYSALSDLNKTSENLSTAEDPVEFNLAGINQVQMHDSIGLNFAAALRSFLRQDPDIIMVGEIRDFETAEIAVKAALTGHMVLSTLHTNDAPSTVHRLLNMGMEPFLVTASVNAILAQRLARRVCKDCKEPIPTNDIQELIKLGMTAEVAARTQLVRGSGCRTCNETGYKGRVALYEIMSMSDEIKELVLEGASTVELKRGAMRYGMKTLRQAALSKLEEGMTTVSEVVRCSVAD
ncbi:type IV-A pilus assembly ATPase PilB [Myxococcota bacterium]|nr:type IV-A pilus assembly ATPase PilB [Myxococcota bacterium]MBU1432622.1 type IV-A pilus assembly ATPase PilB [Myxococcota bacterium]MBU1899515.1 type IV-A pilus assembly ATPase PilB [Myxococcota bacterium]